MIYFFTSSPNIVFERPIDETSDDPDRIVPITEDISNLITDKLSNIGYLNAYRKHYELSGYIDRKYLDSILTIMPIGSIIKNDELYLIWRVLTLDPLTEELIDYLKTFIKGQCTNGWGEDGIELSNRLVLCPFNYKNFEDFKVILTSQPNKYID